MRREFIVIIKQNSILYNSEIQPMYDQEEWEDDFEFEDSGAKKNKNAKADKFQQFEADRKILKKQDKKMSDSMNFGNSVSKSKSKGKAKKQQRYEEEDDYGDDFEGEEDKQKSPLKNSFSKNNNSSSFDNKLKKNKTDKKLNRSPTEKKKISKSSLSANREEESKGRYMQEVEKKFYEHNNPSNLSNDAINRVNTQIRETIKKYNDILSQLITKNLNNYMQAKNKKSHTVDDEIKVLQEEIKNNQKLEERVGLQLRSLHTNVQRMEEKEEYSDKGIEEEITETKKEIKEMKKFLNEKKLQVENQGKRLVGGRNTFKPNSSGERNSEVTITKEKLLTVRKEFEKNEQRIEELDKRQNDLTKKIGSIEGKQKQADEIITITKKNQQKSKKYQQVRKRLENSKNHSNKTRSLWNTKYGVIEHENQAIRQKIKNIELEVKNLEESISSVYEKTQKALQNPKLRKAEEGNQQKVLLDKLVDDMKVYDPNMKRQQSTTQMKLFQNKKSSANLGQNSKMGEEDEKANRIWKEQKQESSQKRHHQMEKERNEENVNVKKEPQEKKTNIQSQRYSERAKIAEKSEERMSLQQQNEGEGDQKENKPKKFNFKKNRKSSETKLSQLQEKIDPTRDDLKNHENQFMKKQVQPQIVHKPLNSQEGIPKTIEQNEADKPAFVPKRFNLRAKKSSDQGYMPSGQQQPQESNAAESKQKNEGEKKEGQNTETTRPMFKLKKKNRQSVEGMQNQFIS